MGVEQAVKELGTTAGSKMLKVLSHQWPAGIGLPPSAASNCVAQSVSYTMVVRPTPSISTKLATVCPCRLVIVHDGPGEIQPGGVAPGVSQRFAPSDPEMGGFSVIPGE